MGFICVICNKVLAVATGKKDRDELVTTICGHLFHRRCLTSSIRNGNQNRPRGKEKSQCPSCSRYLVSEQASFIIYPVEMNAEPETDDDTGETSISNAIDDVMILMRNENEKLKQKLKSLVSIIENINKQINASQEKDICVDSINCLEISPKRNALTFITSHKNSADDDIFSKRRRSLPFSSGSSKSDYDSLTTTTSDQNCLSDYYTSLKKTDKNGENVSWRTETSVGFHTQDDKNKTYRSTRREFLTTRNKTSSWLSKMTTKGNKLISEAILSDTKSITQQIAEIKFFMNKIETQGIIIDRLKESAKTLMSYEGVAPMEINLTERCSKELERDFCDMHLRISDRIVTLEIALIRCGEIQSFIDESHLFIKDIEDRLRTLQENEDYTTNSSKKTKLYDLACLLRLADSHKSNIDAVKLSENDFRSCDNSQILPETESQLRKACNEYLSLAKKIRSILESLIDDHSLRVQPSKHQRSPVFV